jgi:hypothetical protein
LVFDGLYGVVSRCFSVGTLDATDLVQETRKRQPPGDARKPTFRSAST